MKKKYIKFKIFPIKGKKEYYDVYIFNDRVSMRMFSAQIFNPNHSYLRMEAATHSFSSVKLVDGKEVPGKLIGAILFYKGGFGHGVVTHEMSHAVNYYFLRNKIKFNIGGKHCDEWQERDELYAWAVGYLTNQFWKKYNNKIGKKNLYERY